MSDRNTETFDLVWMQRLGGGEEVLERNIPAAQALARLQQADRENYGAGTVCYLRPSTAPTIASLEGDLAAARVVIAVLEEVFAREVSMSALRIALAQYHQKVRPPRE